MDLQCDLRLYTLLIDNYGCNILRYFTLGQNDIHL